MSKLNINSNSILKTLTFLCLLSLPGLSMSDENRENSLSENILMPKSREGSLALIGTWIISTPHNAPKTDKIIINGGASNADGVISAVGTYVPEGVESELGIICIDSNDLSYRCFADNSEGGFVAFFFTIAGNKISNGFFGIGQSIDIAGSVALSEQFPITGYRLSSGAKVNANGELTIPAVEYEGQFYRVVLQDEGGFKFGIKEVSAVE